MMHTWSQLSFIHWPYSPGAVQALLPPGLTVDPFDDRAWVGLIPFHVTINPPGVPRVPWVSSFPEMNVRTYVRGPDGAPGIYFLSCDAARLGAVVIARGVYRIAYHWAKTEFARAGDFVTYTSRRRWPGPRGASSKVVVEVGDAYGADEISDLEAFLTARWRFFCLMRRGLAYRLVSHAPWPLARARVAHCDDGLIAACGLPPPSEHPLAMYSESVDVAMGAPHLCSGGGSKSD